MIEWLHRNESKLENFRFNEQEISKEVNDEKISNFLQKPIEEISATDISNVLNSILEEEQKNDTTKRPFILSHKTDIESLLENQFDKQVDKISHEEAKNNSKKKNSKS